MISQDRNQSNVSNINGEYPYLPLPSVYDDLPTRDGEVPSAAYYIIHHHKQGTPWNAILLAVCYYVLTTTFPLFNTLLFKGWGPVKGFPYPLSATWIQLIGVFILLLIYSIIMHYLQRKDVLKKSWAFGPGFFWKCKHLILVSIAFAAVISLTNMGLFLVDLNTHVLLRSSEIVWVVLFALLIQKEIPSIGTIICCLVLIVGTVLVSMDFTQKIKSSAVALVINLTASLASGLMIVLLRRACVILRSKDPTISVLEITFFKIIIASIVLIPPTFIVEPGAFKALIHDNTTQEYQVTLLVGAGVLLTMFYQSVMVGLTTYSLAITVGIISQTKIIPQVALAIAYNNDFRPTALHISGMLLLIGGSVGYAILRWRIHKKQESEKKLGKAYSVDH